MNKLKQLKETHIECRRHQIGILIMTFSVVAELIIILTH